MQVAKYKYERDDLLNLVGYSAGLYRTLTGTPCIVIYDRVDLRPGDTITLLPTHFVDEQEPILKAIFTPPKKDVRGTLERETLEHLCQFIDQRCRLAKRFKVTATDLHRAFEAEVDQTVSHNRLFPKLMEEVMRLNRSITKRTTGGKTVYHGIRLFYAPAPVLPPPPADEDEDEDGEEDEDEK